MFSFGGAQRQQLRHEQALARMAEPRPNNSMKTPEQRDASLKGLSLDVIKKEPFLKSVRDDPNVRQAFVELNFYCPQKRNYFACSNCDKGAALRSDPRQEGLTDLIRVHNEQSKPHCSKDISVVAHLLSQPYMPSQQTPQAAFSPSHYQGASQPRYYQA